MNGAEKLAGRMGWLFTTALLATIAIALAFVDAARPRLDGALETQAGFFAIFGLAASTAFVALARLLRIVLGRAKLVRIGGRDVSDRA